MKFDLCTIDWAAIGVIATLLMVIATFIALIVNFRQIAEIKRQWKEENRARLSFSIAIKQGMILLKISNIGKNTAYGINFTFNQDFLDIHFSNHIRNLLTNLQNKDIIIEAGITKHFYLSPIYGESDHRIGGKEDFTVAEINKWLDEYKSKKIEIKGTYCGVYEINESFSIEQFSIESMVVSDELTNAMKDIRKGSVILNNSYMPIQKSLHLIMEHLKKIEKNIENNNTQPNE